MTGALFKVLLLSSLIGAAPSGHLKRHWRETDSETLWTVRYTNCDYGYSVLLRPGVVAHGTHLPSPNHGFLVSLPDVGKTSEATANQGRYIYLDASYDASDSQSVSAAVDELRIIQKAKASDHVRRSRFRLVGLPATELTVWESAPNGDAVDESIIAVRSGIIYTIALHSNTASQVKDEREFRRIAAGFRWLPLPKGDCSNG